MNNFPRPKKRKDVIHEIAQATNSGYVKEWLPIIRQMTKETYLTRGNPQDFILCQVKLLKYIIDVGQERKSYQRNKNMIGKALKSLSMNGAPKERIATAQSRFEQLQTYEMATGFVESRLRGIGDAAAWRFLNYDRATLRLLSEHDVVGIPQVGPGLFAEVERLSEVALAEGRQVILNAITNCLRIGDITAYDPATGNIELIEVKSGISETRRTIRQQTTRIKAQTAIDTGIVKVGDVEIEKLVSNQEFVSHIFSVERAIKEAKVKHASTRLFEDYLAVAVYWIPSMTSELTDKEQSEIQNRTMDRLYSVAKGPSDILVPMQWNWFLISHFSPLFTPYLNFPIDPEIRFSIFTGEVVVMSLLNLSGVARWMERRGWEVVLLEPPESIPWDDENLFIPAMEVSNGRAKIQLPFEVFSLAALEFWGRESFERTLTTILEKTQTDGRHQVVFPNTGKYAWD